MCVPGIVATNNAGGAADPARHNGIVERAEGLAIDASLHIGHILVGEAGNNTVYVIGDLHLGFVPVGKVIDGSPYNLLRDLQRLIFMELDTLRPGDMGLRRRGDNLGVVVLCDLHKALHDTLDINEKLPTISTP